MAWHNRNKKAVAGTALARLVVRMDHIRFRVPPCPGRQVGQVKPVLDVAQSISLNAKRLFYCAFGPSVVAVLLTLTSTKRSSLVLPPSLPIAAFGRAATNATSLYRSSSLHPGGRRLV